MSIGDMFQKKTYEVKAVCSNCNSPPQLAKLPKGVTVEEGIKDVPCMDCGCRGLEVKK